MIDFFKKYNSIEMSYKNLYRIIDLVKQRLWSYQAIGDEKVWKVFLEIKKILNKISKTKGAHFFKLVVAQAVTLEVGFLI